MFVVILQNPFFLWCLKEELYSLEVVMINGNPFSRTCTADFHCSFCSTEEYSALWNTWTWKGGKQNGEKSEEKEGKRKKIEQCQCFAILWIMSSKKLVFSRYSWIAKLRLTDYNASTHRRSEFQSLRVRWEFIEVHRKWKLLYPIDYFFLSWEEKMGTFNFDDVKDESSSIIRFVMFTSGVSLKVRDTVIWTSVLWIA